MRFAGKTAVITGGGDGIGLTFAEALAREGAAIGILDLDAGRGQAAARAIIDAGGRAVASVCDVADEAMVDHGVGQVTEALGGPDILINCAARHLSFYNQPCTVLPRAHWRQMLDVNVVGIVNCAASCRPGMAARGGGVVINISSIASITLAGPYGVSKLAVRGLTVALAQELAVDNIRVCGIAPGLVDSPAAAADVNPAHAARLVEQMQLIKRPGRMEDLIGTLFYLCSDDAGFVTGETIVVGGGYPLRA